MRSELPLLPLQLLDPGPLRFGGLTLGHRFLLSPLAGYTNLPFRLVLRELGGLGLATTDLVNARALLERRPKSFELIQTCLEDRPLAVQIYGAVEGELRDAAGWLEEYGVDAIDINMGCPVCKVVRGGGGSAMLCDRERTLNLVRAVVQAVRIPVTVKMRLGWDETQLSAPEFAREFERIGVAAVIVHGRTRAQGFRGAVNREGIRAVVEAVERIPVIGNGDVLNFADAARMFAETGCAAVAIGRGALLNPWIFARFARWARGLDPGPEPGFAERLTFMERHFRRMVELKGERTASLQFRKVARWYCKTIRPSRELHNRLMQIQDLADFEATTARIRRSGPRELPLGSAEAPAIPVPAGPVSHW